jgi:hypothetical protein
VSPIIGPSFKKKLNKKKNKNKLGDSRKTGIRD